MDCGNGISVSGRWKLKRNEGTMDRVIRVVLGAVTIAAGILVVEGGWRAVLVAAGSVSLGTGVFGFCLLYVLLGISTRKSREEHP